MQVQRSALPGWFVGSVLVSARSMSAQTLPAGPGADVLKSRCVICHEADIITSQKLSLTGWTNSINKMVRWGSQITPQEREVLLPYLARAFRAASRRSQPQPQIAPTVAQRTRPPTRARA